MLLETVESISAGLNLNLTKKDIIDIAYLIFFYGIDVKLKNMIKDKINRKHLEDFYKKLLAEKNYMLKNEKINIDRTNHTSLSAYFRNMYNEKSE